MVTVFITQDSPALVEHNRRLMFPWTAPLNTYQSSAHPDLVGCVSEWVMAQQAVCHKVETTSDEITRHPNGKLAFQNCLAALGKTGTLYNSSFWNMLIQAFSWGACCPAALRFGAGRPCCRSLFIVPNGRCLEHLCACSCTSRFPGIVFTACNCSFVCCVLWYLCLLWGLLM